MESIHLPKPKVILAAAILALVSSATTMGFAQEPTPQEPPAPVVAPEPTLVAEPEPRDPYFKVTKLKGSPTTGAISGGVWGGSETLPNMKLHRSPEPSQFCSAEVGQS